ncbi:MAG: ABC transporter permease [Chryseolinea sp.]
MSLKTILFLRTIFRHKEIYGLKLGSQAIAIACSILVILFSMDEFSYDCFHRDYENIFRVLQKNTHPAYNGNRLSNRISTQSLDLIRKQSDSTMIFCRIKRLNEINVVAEGKTEYDQYMYAADKGITSIFSFDIIDGSLENFTSCNAAIISARNAKERFGKVNVSGEKFRAFTYGDTIEYTIAAVYKDYPENSHEDFDCIVSFDRSSIHSLYFTSSEFSVYGKSNDQASAKQDVFGSRDILFKFQPLSEIYFGPRVLGEESKHGDRYSITILLFITALILILALSTTINLSTLTMPQRAKELALKKLAGSSQNELILSSIRESFLTVLISFVLALLILAATSEIIHSTLAIRPWKMLSSHIVAFCLVIIGMTILLVMGPVIISLRFIKSTPTRLLSSKAITFPRLKDLIVFIQMGVSVFLIVVSVVTRRQVNYSLIKEPGQNNDQVVYLEFPSQMTSKNLIDLRTKSSNPHIIDAIATSQLPNRISSKDLNTDTYFMGVDPGFKDFFWLDHVRRTLV